MTNLERVGFLLCALLIALLLGGLSIVAHHNDQHYFKTNQVYVTLGIRG